MARIAGIDLPKNKRGEIGLTYIFGIGRSSAQKILKEAKIDFNKKVSEWSDDETNAIRKVLNEKLKLKERFVQRFNLTLSVYKILVLTEVFVIV